PGEPGTGQEQARAEQRDPNRARTAVAGQVTFCTLPEARRHELVLRRLLQDLHARERLVRLRELPLVDAAPMLSFQRGAAHRTPGEAGQFRLTGDLRSDGDGFETFVSSPHVWSAGRILNGGAPRVFGRLAHLTAMECSIALPHRLFTAADRVRREHC